MEETEANPAEPSPNNDSKGKKVVEKLCGQIKLLHNRLYQQENILTNVLIEGKTREANYEVSFKVDGMIHCP